MEFVEGVEGRGEEGVEEERGDLTVGIEPDEEVGELEGEGTGGVGWIDKVFGAEEAEGAKV